MAVVENAVIGLLGTLAGLAGGFDASAGSTFPRLLRVVE
jgi:hypothetical protein